MSSEPSMEKNINGLCNCIKVKHRQSIFLENTVELSKYEFILVTF